MPRPEHLRDHAFDAWCEENRDRLTPRDPITMYTVCEAVHADYSITNTHDFANCDDCEIYGTYTYPSIMHEIEADMNLEDEYKKLNPGWEPIIYTWSRDTTETIQTSGMFMDEFNALSPEERKA